jgi:hypothetical protein
MKWRPLANSAHKRRQALCQGAALHITVYGNEFKNNFYLHKKINQEGASGE